MVANPKVMESETALVPYNLEAAIIEGLKAKYLDVTIQPDDRAAYSMVMGGLRECREIRLNVDAWHKDKKEEIIRAGKHYDAERRRVHALVEPIEAHLAAVRKAEDDRKEAVRAEKERIERERVDGIRAKIAAMSRKVFETQGKASREIAMMITDFSKDHVTTEGYQEFVIEAGKVATETMEALVRACQDREKWENEQAAAKAESERLEKIRQEQEDEKRRIAYEKAEIEAARKSLEAAKRADQERAEREALEKKLAEEARIKAEADAKAKAEREAKEAELKAQREAEEAARKEKLKPDKEKLIAYGNALLNVPYPVPKHKKAKQHLTEIMSRLAQLVDDLKSGAEAL